MVRPRFDPTKPLVAARSFTYFGHDYKAGDAFPIEGAPAILPFKLKTLYGSRSVNHGEGTAAPTEPADQVVMTATPGGWYDITAPWLDDPLRVRGKKKAEQAAQKLRDEGEPDCHHGVCIEEGQNGWWSVQADWMGDNAYNIHGEAAAREQAAKLREEGDPVKVEEQGDEFIVTAAWLANPIGPLDRAKADYAADQVRDAGPPLGWSPPAETE